ncbi:MAG: MogA/MoaB family molybdenum cofactor biosynthesis protein [Acidobacteriota bacterium]|jgi:molybdenum cofactor synthesis domain-containing protein|nr:MogA/MoaB family molybdenum cofactor biosynthesis protein [Acidobacteriota bacterium]
MHKDNSDNKKIKIRAIIVTISDTRDESNDTSGEILAELLTEIGAEIIDRIIVTDDFENLRQTLYSLTEREANLILTTGGTGFAERDNTPEATLSVIEKETPGISEAMRFETLNNTKFAMLSRGVSGIRNGTLIINLPGSPKGVAECFDVIKEVLPHAVNQILGNTKHEKE